jgi:hypothetical protein
VVPLHVSGPKMRKLSNLALVCANCHRMLHRVPWLKPVDLKGLIRINDVSGQPLPNQRLTADVPCVRLQFYVLTRSSNSPFFAPSRNASHSLRV